MPSAIAAALSIALVTARGTYGAELTKIDLHGLWMQRFRKALPGITNNAIHKGRVPIIFPADMNQQRMLNGGLVARAGEIVCYAPGTEHHLQTPVGWHSATISLTPKDFAEYGRTLLGHEPNHLLPVILRIILQTFLVHPKVAEAIQQELVRAVMRCLTEGEPVGTVRGTQQPVMQRFEQALEAHEGEPIYVAGLCAEIGVSGRCLLRHCKEPRNSLAWARTDIFGWDACTWLGTLWPAPIPLRRP